MTYLALALGVALVGVACHPRQTAEDGLAASADPRVSSGTVRPSRVGANDVASTPDKTWVPSTEECYSIFEDELNRTNERPVYLHSRHRVCRRAARRLAAARNVLVGDPRDPLRGACPGRRCGPVHGTLIVVDPESKSGRACFGVWSYLGTSGSKQTLCLDDGGVRATGSVIVY